MRVRRARSALRDLPVLWGQRDPRVTWARWGLRDHKGRAGRQVRPDPKARRATRAPLDLREPLGRLDQPGRRAQLDRLVRPVLQDLPGRQGQRETLDRSDPKVNWGRRDLLDRKA